MDSALIEFQFQFQFSSFARSLARRLIVQVARLKSNLTPKSLLSRSMSQLNGGSGYVVVVVKSMASVLPIKSSLPNQIKNPKHDPELPSTGSCMPAIDVRGEKVYSKIWSWFVLLSRLEQLFD